MQKRMPHSNSRPPMTDAGWTAISERTGEGVYWWRRPGREAEIASVYRERGTLYLWLPTSEPRDEAIVLASAHPDTELLGPISPDDRQQGRVEGLQLAQDTFAKRFFGLRKDIDCIPYILELERLKK